MTTTTHPAFEIPTDTGRDLDPGQLLRQMNPGTLLAVSGGRWRRIGISSIGFPCGAGYEVLVTLEADDTYTVRRLFKRGARVFLHGERSNVYCDEVSEVVYFCSCFRSYSADEWPSQV